MIPVSHDFHGYVVKPAFQHLLPTVLGRPTDYLLFPFCLPSHDPMYRLAIQDLEQEIGPDLDRKDQRFPGSFNSKLL